ncbi:MAG TPA: ABC transporter ATP-binding protein [Thermodesulfovibrionales bacterium]|nr:ABC transporter ATP-binding protein [Thermodesulfovibrionales bacterium]
MALLEAAGLSYRTHEKEILSDLDLFVDAGEIHALVGTNGTGKSTLAYLIMGCQGYRPASGEILFNGQLINGLKLHERAAIGIAMAWQEPVRFEGISVRQYLTLKQREADPSRYLEMVGLPPDLYLGRMVDKCLSGGERKRVELASILALRPKLAILDEPDSGIDMLSTQDIINVITLFKQNGSAVLLITHREEIALIADRASQLCRGRIVCSGSPREVAEYYKSRKCVVCDKEVCSE